MDLLKQFISKVCPPQSENPDGSLSGRGMSRFNLNYMIKTNNFAKNKMINKCNAELAENAEKRRENFKRQIIILFVLCELFVKNTATNKYVFRKPVRLRRRFPMDFIGTGNVKIQPPLYDKNRQFFKELNDE